MRIGSLFSGIGGLDLGLERSGLGRVVWHCELNPFARAILKTHWPDVPCYADIHTLCRDNLSPIDALCGGFPCQDVSQAGLRAGLEAGARSGLWREYARLIEELAPRLVIIENVLGLRARGLRTVLADLAALGFDAEWTTVRASDVGAPHRRERFFIVAHRRDDGLQGLAQSDRAHGSLGEQPGRDADRCRVDGFVRRLQQALEPGMVRGADGAADRMDYPASRGRGQHVWEPRRTVDRTDPNWTNKRKRIFVLGNAVAPGCAQAVGRALQPEREP